MEINATFYRYFTRSVFARWRDETAESFRFTLKGPKTITHLKRLVDIEDDLARFFDSVQDLHPKLRVVLWQFPYSFKNLSDENIPGNMQVLQQFLGQLPDTVRHVIEFRHKSWFTEDVYTVLNAHNAGFVINDSSRFPAAETVTGNIVYVRLHGPAQLYASPYSTEALQAWADKITKWREQYDVFCYFNNDFGGHALANSVELQKIIAPA